MLHKHRGIHFIKERCDVDGLAGTEVAFFWGGFPELCPPFLGGL